MTVYVAVCDDNIADRKQMERLLEREKDARLKKASDVMYIESFGSKEALMRTPVKYDIFFIDITGESENGMDIAKSLRKMGVIAPIVLCSSSIDYSSYVNTPDDVTIISKPVSAGQIQHYIDYASDWTRNKTPLLEIRCQSNTFFVKHTDIIKAVPIAKFLTRITLCDGTILDMSDPIRSLLVMCRPYSCFIICGKTVINVKYIIGSKDNAFVMADNSVVKYPFYKKKAILEAIGDSIPASLL